MSNVSMHIYMCECIVVDCLVFMFVCVCVFVLCLC